MKTFPNQIQLPALAICSLIYEAEANGDLTDTRENIETPSEELTLEGQFIVKALNKTGIKTGDQVDMLFDKFIQPLLYGDPPKAVYTLIDILNIMGIKDFNKMAIQQYVNKDYTTEKLYDAQQKVKPHHHPQESYLGFDKLVQEGITIKNFPWEELEFYLTHFDQMLNNTILMPVIDSNVS